MFFISSRKTLGPNFFSNRTEISKNKNTPSAMAGRFGLKNSLCGRSATVIDLGEKFPHSHSGFMAMEDEKSRIWKVLRG